MKTTLTLKRAWMLLLLLVLTHNVYAEEMFLGIFCPEDKYVDCDDELWDLSIYGNATYKDYSGEYDAGHPEMKKYLNSCNIGYITRTWTVTLYGRKHSCTQTIYVGGADETEVKIDWPEDMDIEGCNPSVHPSQLKEGAPTWDYASCRMLASSYDDQWFNFGSKGCKKLIREWTVMDWCVYDPVYNRHEGIYYYRQAIKISSSDEPVFETLEDIYESSTNCKDAYVTAPSLVVDPSSCEGNFTIKNDSPYASSNGADISGRYPIGTTEVKFTISFGCGHKKTTTVNVTVKDDLLPTPYCYGSMNVVLMGIDTDDDGINDQGMVEVWAKDLDKGSTVGCNRDKIYFSFSEDISDDVRVFTCDEVGPNEIRLYITDEFGNQNFCTVNLKVQNNMAQIINCEYVVEEDEEEEVEEENEEEENTTTYDSSIFVAGLLLDAFANGVSGAEILVKGIDDELFINATYDTTIVTLLDSFLVGEEWGYEVVFDTIVNATHDTILVDVETIVSTGDLGTYTVSNFFLQGGSYMIKAMPMARKNEPTSHDLRAIFDHVTGKKVFTSPLQYLAADVNEDGLVDLDDVREVINVIMKIQDGFKVEEEVKITKASFNYDNPEDILHDPMDGEYMLETIQEAFINGDFVLVELGILLNPEINVRRNSTSTRELIAFNSNVKDDLLINELNAFFGYELSFTEQAHFYPNPAFDVLNAEIVAASEEPISIAIYGVDGQQMQTLTTLLEVGKNQITLDINELPSGIYLYQLIGRSRQDSGRFIVRK